MQGLLINTARGDLINIPAPYDKKIFLSPHLGGITAGTFRRAHAMMWENAARIEAGEKPLRVVGGI